MPIDKIFLFRMTHIDNVPSILENGITHRDSVNANPDYISIGDVSLIGTRNNKSVSITNGENHGCETAILGEYIPFYFGVRMPMLYVIQKGGNFVSQAISPSKIVYVVCKLKNLIESGLEYIFSDGHATDNFTNFYDSTKINDIDTIIDFESVKARQWSGENIPLDLKRKKQAEFLIKGDVIPGLITGFGCYNKVSKKKLIDFGINENSVKVIPSAYY